MSLIKANAVQVGQSPTATQNFTLAVPSSPDGTIKLARGNAGATTQDVLNVDASGNINGLVKSTSSTTARSLANRFADVVNVKDFGAVGNGVADDTAAIQAAVNSITSSGTVVFPSGNYYITNAITVTNKSISFIGASSASTKITLFNLSSSGAFVFTSNNNETAFSVSGFTFLAKSNNAGIAISSTFTVSSNVDYRTLNVNDVQIRYIVGQGYWTGGILNSGSKWSTLSKCYVQGPDVSSTAFGFKIVGTDNVEHRITDCSILGASKGLEIGDSVEGVYIVNYSSVACQYGIYAFTPTGEPLISITNFHIDSTICGLFLKNTFQGKYSNGLIYCNQNASSAYTFVHIEQTAQYLSSTNQFINIELNGTTNTTVNKTGIKIVGINGGNRVYATLLPNFLTEAVNFGVGVSECDIELIQPLNVTTLVIDNSGNTNNSVSVNETRDITTILKKAFASPLQTYDYNYSNTFPKFAELECIGTDTTKSTKKVAFVQAVARDPNWVDTDLTIGIRTNDLINVAYIILKPDLNATTGVRGYIQVDKPIVLAGLRFSTSFANDTAAAAGGIPLGGLYRNGSVVQIRMT